MIISNTVHKNRSLARYRAQNLAKGSAGLLVVLLLSACAGVQPVKTENVQDRVKAIAPSRPDGSVRIDTEELEVARLWSAAEQARRSGQNPVALELVYEALELAPQNALLWSRAAEIQLDTLEAALAESYATKSNAYAEENQALLYRNWLIIEHARNMRGDLLGVRSAHKKVQQYQKQ